MWLTRPCLIMSPAASRLLFSLPPLCQLCGSQRTGKFFQEMGLSDHLTCLLRNLYAGQEATVRTRHGTRTGSKLGKEYIKAVYCHPAYLTSMQSTSWEMPGWMKHKLESRLLREISQICIISQIRRWHHPYDRKRGTKEPLDDSERGEWKGWLESQHSENEDHGIQSHHFMADRWKTVETVTTLFSWAPKSLLMDCSHEIKRPLLLGRKAVTNLDSIIKSREITSLAQVRLIKIYGFSSGHVWMGELDDKESWAPNNWCFWTVVLEKTLESPFYCKEIRLVSPKGNQSWTFIRRTDVEAEAPILWPPVEKNWLIGKDHDAGKDWR